MEKNVTSDDGLELRYKRYKRTLKELTIMSDAFMRNVFKKPECTEYLLRVIMEEAELKIVEQVLQKDYKNLQGRSAVLDCVARASGGKYYNVEIQQETEGASTKRARYHSGLLDMNILNPGEDFTELPETCVIFITRKERYSRQRASHLPCGAEDKRNRGEFQRRITYHLCKRRETGRYRAGKADTRPEL